MPGAGAVHHIRLGSEGRQHQDAVLPLFVCGLETVRKVLMKSCAIEPSVRFFKTTRTTVRWGVGRWTGSALIESAFAMVSNIGLGRTVMNPADVTSWCRSTVE